MARKKKKHQGAPYDPSDSSDEGRETGCTHTNRALDVGQLKRALRNGLPLRCHGCLRPADAPTAGSESPVTACKAPRVGGPEADDPCVTPVAPKCASEVVALARNFAFNGVEASLPESNGRQEASLPESARDVARTPPLGSPDHAPSTLPVGDECAGKFDVVTAVPPSDKVPSSNCSEHQGPTTDCRSRSTPWSVANRATPQSIPGTREKIVAVPPATVTGSSHPVDHASAVDAFFAPLAADSPGARPSSSRAVLPDDVTTSTFLVCLRCGHVGCGSGGPHHALAHFSTPHSDPHCLALSLDTWTLWCYECDKTVGSSRRLEQAVQFVRKRTNGPAGPAPVGEAKPRVAGRLAKNRPEGQETDSSFPSRDGDREVRRVKGLANLGNTCYFNSVMQSLVQTTHLEGILQERCRQGLRATFHPAEDSAEVGPLEVELPQAWPLTRALLEFLQEMRHGKPRPRPVFSQVCNIAPQFRGNQQNDSHELLRHLLEGICNEEVKRQKQAVLASFGLSSKADPNRVDAAVKSKIQAYKEAVARTALDSLFGGVLLSTVVCQECGHIQRREEPFKDLSLPIPDDKVVRLPKKVAEETRGRKTDPKGRRRNPDRKARARRDTGSDNPITCTLSGGSSQQPAEAEEADDEGPAAVAEEGARVAPVALAETLAPRPLQPLDGSLLACLHQFTAPELLAGANALLCEGCGQGVRSAASLQLLVQQVPRVLTLHLKRFHQNGRSLCKVNRHVPFPLLLDLAPYCSPQKLEPGPVPYSLYAVVEHSGRLSGGHYTAYVKVRPESSAGSSTEGRWYHASDAHVSDTTEEAVLQSQAYLLFYEQLQ